MTLGAVVEEGSSCLLDLMTSVSCPQMRLERHWRGSARLSTVTMDTQGRSVKTGARWGSLCPAQRLATRQEVSGFRNPVHPSLSSTGLELAFPFPDPSFSLLIPSYVSICLLDAPKGLQGFMMEASPFLPSL